jgi:hypothetical protein
MELYVRGGDAVAFKLTAPWGQSWNIPLTYDVGSWNGFVTVGSYDYLEAFSSDRDPTGTWTFQITYTPDTSGAADGFVTKQALTFFPSSLW